MSTDHTSQPDTVSLSHAMTVLLRRWRIVLACTVLGVLLAGVAYVITPASYQATSQVLVSPLPVALSATATGAQSVTAKDVSMATEVGLATSPDVAASAATGLKYTGSPSDLLAHVDVQNPTDSLLLLITYTASTPDAAAKGANAFAQAYYDVRAGAVGDAKNLLLGTTKTQIDDLTKSVGILNGKIQTETGAAQDADKFTRNAQLAQIDSLESLQNKVHLLDLTPAVVSNATAPTSPSAPKRSVYLVIGLLLGLLVGCLLAALRESRDKTVHSYVDLEGITGERVLGRVPGRSSSAEVDESYRQIAVHLRASAPEVTPLMLAVIGPRDQALSAVPALVARGVAAIGSTVLLATVDHSGAALPAGPSVVTTDLGPEAQFAARSAAPDLGLLGKSPSQVVVLDGVNIAQESTALVLAEAAAGVVVAVAQDRTNRRELAALLDTLRQVGTPVLGLVVVEKGGRTTSAPAKELEAQPVSVAAALESSRVPTVRS
ncbi:MAG TPA: Wzz/FepE/Etk N-terminal domain-containing protein [Candidatus Nanopelagicales bacterium]|nr:Wzz/FepE/Etk N-terminal domain-containing protein [Candidatus Nanopelagicales bacterium]